MGTTMSGASGGAVVGIDIIANTLTMGSKEITVITDDPTSGSPESLITALALQTAVAGLIGAIQTNVQNVLTGLDGLVVLTQNLVNPDFSLLSQDPLLGWTTVGWTIQSNTASIANVNNVFATSNKLSVPAGRYPNTGVYFLTITASSVSGTLSVVLNNVSVGTITAPGTYNFVLTVPNAINTTLDLVASGVADNQSIILTNAILTGINPILYDLLIFIAQQLAVGESAGTINAAIASTLSTSEAFTTTSVAAAIAAHLAAANPHPQYALLSEISDTAILPDVIVFSPDAYIPPQIPGKNKLRSSTVLKTRTLNHISTSSYSPEAGYVSSTAASSNLANAMISSGGSSILPTTTFTLTPSALPVITYVFAKQRKLSEVALFTELQSGVACVTQATISAGGVTRTVNITPGTVNTVVAANGMFSNILVSQVVITVLSVNDTTQANLSLGFNIYFSDTAGQDIAISGETVLAINYDGQIKTFTPGADIPVNVSSLIQGHEYLVSLLTSDGISLTTELLEIPPVWGDGSINYRYPLGLLTSNVDPYYGTVTANGLTNSATYYQVYTTDGAVVSNSNYVLVEQDFVKPLSIDHINVNLPGVLASGQAYPTNITVNVTEASGTQDSISFTPILVVDGVSSVYTIPFSLSTYGPLSSFQVVLTSANGTNCAISKIDVGVSCISYDTTQHTWSDGLYRKIVGSITEFSNGAYQITSQPVGGDCVVPINDLLSLQFYTQYAIQNPFKTKNVTAIPINPDGSLTNNVIVQTITDSTITVLCTSAGIYLLDITRSS